MTAGGAATAIGGSAITLGGAAGLSLVQSYHDFHGFGGGMGGMALTWIGPLLAFLFVMALLVLIAALVWRLVRGGRESADREARTGAAGASRESPLEVLEHRYARGEVDREEYLQKRDDLTGG